MQVAVEEGGTEETVGCVGDEEGDICESAQTEVGEERGGCYSFHGCFTLRLSLQ